MNTILNEENKQKKTVIALVAVALVGGIAAFLLVTHFVKTLGQNRIMKENMSVTMEGFTGAMEDGNVTKAKSFCSDPASSALGLSMLDADGYRNVVLSGLGLEEETLCEEIKTELDAFTAAQKSKVMTDCEYEMKSMKLKKTEDGGTGRLEVVFSGVPSLYSVDFSQKIVKGNEDLAAYVSENRETLINVYGTEGEVVTYNVLKMKEVTSLLSSMTDQMLSTEPVERKYAFTFTLTMDEDGKVEDCLISGVEELTGEEKK